MLKSAEPLSPGGMSPRDSGSMRPVHTMKRTPKRPLRDRKTSTWLGHS